MQEAEFTSELVIAMLNGMQDKKKTINLFYEKYDESLPEKDKIVTRFQNTIDNISEALGSYIAESEFRRTPLFYSLFCAMYDRLYGLPKYGKSISRSASLSNDDRQKFRDAVVKLSDFVTAYRDEDDIPKGYQSFVLACLQQTDNIAPRRTRYLTIFKEAFD